jgi:DNA (cytosine-5)-methyltransferase 1
MKNKAIRFVDLFAGIGGFHQAICNISSKNRCVWASEIEKATAGVYESNFGINPLNDITKINEKDIPKFDLLCAGFPCQPFSKGGNQKGFDDIRGTLFFDIIRILKFHQPKFVILENVSNLLTHDNGNTYRVISESLKKLGYSIPTKPVKLTPLQFGIPIHRPRLFIPAVYGKNVIDDFEMVVKDNHFRKSKHVKETFSFEKSPSELNIELSDYELKVLKMWDDFYKGINLKTIGFPIWYDFFKYSGDIECYPKWKQNFIRKNMQLYKDNQDFINKWEKKFNYLQDVVKTHRKFEWQCGEDFESIFDCIIQFRPSGIRVKRPVNFSTLVAMNHSQIIGWEKRRLTINEVRKLQGFPDTFKFTSNRQLSMKQLGNAVNVKVVEELLNSIINYVQG